MTWTEDGSFFMCCFNEHLLNKRSSISLNTCNEDFVILKFLRVFEPCRVSVLDGDGAQTLSLQLLTLQVSSAHRHATFSPPITKIFIV